MHTRKRAGFTLPEALVAGAMFLCIAAAFFFTWSGSRREEELAALHLSMLESAAVAMQQLRTDLREMVVLSTMPTVEGASLRVSPDGSALMLRQGALGDQIASPFMLVEYTLAQTPSHSGAIRYHLVRTRRTSNGSALPGEPGRRESRERTEFRTFTLAGASFNYLPPRPGTDPRHGDDHVIHVTFQVVSETGQANGPDNFSEKTMLLTQVMRFLKPPHPRTFAQPLNVPGLEEPPQDVTSESLAELSPLPAFEEQ